MAEIPNNLKFLDSHEWARLEEDGTVTVGISDHAQGLLGDIVFVELPDTGKTISKKDDIAIVESVKAASDIYAPLAGTIRAVNNQLDEAPELVNESPYDDAWFFVIEPSDPNAFDGLLTAEAYEALCEASDH